MPRNRKSTPSLPKLFKRGKKGYYYFRRHIDGKDKWICTNSPVQRDAKTFAGNYMDAEIITIAESKRNKSAHKLGSAFVETLTKQPEVFTPLNDAHQIWIDHFPKYNDVSENSRRNYSSMFNRFVGWGKEFGIECIEAVDNSSAIRYSKYLWEQGYAGATYNMHLKHLSRVFNTVDSVKPLPHRNPFNHNNIPRIKKNQLGTIGHEPLEPQMLEAVLQKAAEVSQDYRDLFILSSQSGMRLIDSALLKWSSAEKDFLEFEPHKTRNSGNVARIPISPVLRNLLDNRKGESDIYVLPKIAEQYLYNYDYITTKCRKIFSNALGRENTVVEAKDASHRKIAASIYSFHSLRTTFMSLLASKDVSTRDAMRMMAWESPAMIQVYEKMLENARGDSDRRAIDLVHSIEELHYEVPECIIKKQLKPTKEAIEGLITHYSNVTIGKIYDMSDVAVRKWMVKFGITRNKRIVSSNVSEEDIDEIQKQLLGE